MSIRKFTHPSPQNLARRTRALFVTALIAAVFFAGSAYAAAAAPLALVYNGSGACAEQCVDAAADAARAAGFEVQFINAATWRIALLNKARVWVQPGGHSHSVAVALSRRQKSQLRRFVARGGGYVGFCAGGFFASAGYSGKRESDPMVPMLGLIPLLTDVFDNPQDASILTVDWLGMPRFVYWEGGPYFIEPPVPFPHIEAVARYANGQLAALRTTFGAGRVFVTGFHPEAPASWRAYYKMDDPDGLDTELASQMIIWATSPH